MITVPQQTIKAREVAWMYALQRGWFTPRQIEEATEFGIAGARLAEATLGLEDRLPGIREQLLRAASDALERDLMEAQKALMMAVAAIDDAKTAAEVAL